MKDAASVKKTLVFKLTACCVFLLCTLSALSQTRGKLEIIKDSRIDTLLAKRSFLKTGGPSSGAVISSRGYRVQFFMGSSRKEAYDAQARFQEMYPDIRTYIIYHEPNFKVKAGDFRSRLEASKLVSEIRPTFPILFILPEKINPPKLEVPND